MTGTINLFYEAGHRSALLECVTEGEFWFGMEPRVWRWTHGSLFALLTQRFNEASVTAPAPPEEQLESLLDAFVRNLPDDQREEALLRLVSAFPAGNACLMMPPMLYRSLLKDAQELLNIEGLFDAPVLRNTPLVPMLQDIANRLQALPPEQLEQSPPAGENALRWVDTCAEMLNGALSAALRDTLKLLDSDNSATNRYTLFRLLALWCLRQALLVDRHLEAPWPRFIRALAAANAWLGADADDDTHYGHALQTVGYIMDWKHSLSLLQPWRPDMPDMSPAWQAFMARTTDKAVQWLEYIGQQTAEPTP